MNSSSYFVAYMLTILHISALSSSWTFGASTSSLSMAAFSGMVMRAKKGSNQTAMLSSKNSGRSW